MRSLLKVTARTARGIGASSLSKAWTKAYRRSTQKALRQTLRKIVVEESGS